MAIPAFVSTFWIDKKNQVKLTEPYEQLLSEDSWIQIQIEVDTYPWLVHPLADHIGRFAIRLCTGIVRHRDWQPKTSAAPEPHEIMYRIVSEKRIRNRS